MAKRIPLMVAATLVTAFLAVAAARTSRAADTPTTAPAPAPSLAISDKAAPGCCCISTNEPGKTPGCTYGLSEATCAKAGKAVSTWSSTWTAGKCPTP